MEEGLLTTESDSISLKPKERGFVLCYSEKYKRPGSSDFDSYHYEYKELAFGEDELDQAIEKMLELSGKTKATK